MSSQPKIKLLIPVEIKDGCELPDADIITTWILENGYEVDGCLSPDKSYIIRNDNYRTNLNKFTHYRQEQETDLTIDELKKLGVI